MELRIERFRGRLQRTREKMGRRLSPKKGPAIAVALEEIKKAERILDWMPKSGHPGTGATGESTKRMSKGRLP